MKQALSTDQVQTVMVASRPGHHFAWPCSMALLPTGKLLAVFNTMTPDWEWKACGCYSSDGGISWSAPVDLAGGAVQPGHPDPVRAFADPSLLVADDRRVLFFCESQDHDKWAVDISHTHFWRRISEDGGDTFGPLEEIPQAHRYYAGLNHPGMRLRDGTLLLGYSWDLLAEAGRPPAHQGEMDLTSGALLSRDGGMTWAPGGDLHAAVGKRDGAIWHAAVGLCEPAIVELPDGALFLLGRTGSARLWQSWSRDGGRSWEPATPSPLRGHNCPASLIRLAGDDAILCVHNDHPRLRARLSACISTDGCRTWSASKLIGPFDHPAAEEAAYPQAVQLPDGAIAVAYTECMLLDEEHEQFEQKTPYQVRCARFTREYLEC